MWTDLAEIFRKCREWQKLQVIQFWGDPERILENSEGILARKLKKLWADLSEILRECQELPKLQVIQFWGDPEKILEIPEGILAS